MPDWAQPMLAMEATALIARAGEFERASARHREDRGAAPGFERLLSLALQSRNREADMAAACALRSLQRLGHPDVVAIWADPVRARPDMREANSELEDILTRALHQRRRSLPR